MKRKRIMETRRLIVFSCRVLVIACSLSAMFCGCSSKENYEDYLDDNNPVDISDILQAYDYYEEHGGEEMDSMVSSMLKGSIPDAVTYDSPEDPPLIIVYLSEDTSFVLRAPAYVASPHPFLSYAEELYNGYVWIWNVWSNMEFWYRGLTTVPDFDGEDVRDAIKKLDIGILKDKEIRLAAKMCQDSLLALMDLPFDDRIEDIPIGECIDTFTNLVEEKMFSYVTNWDSFNERHSDLVASLGGKDVMKSLMRYENANAETQLKVILDELNSSRNFNDQIILWGLWANSNKSRDEDEWIVAIGERLLGSGLYCPILDNTWLTWRALCQSMYFGLSRDSSIPNQYYNEIRKNCYCACLRRIQSHPDDIFAMNCAYNLARTCNLNRYGQFDYGNNALVEMVMTLPGRFEKE